MEIKVSKAIKIDILHDKKVVDPIGIILESLAFGIGRITINWWCYSWSAHWYSTGKERVEDFVLSCDDHYLAKNLIPGNVTPSRQTQTDYKASAIYLKEKIKDWHTEGFVDDNEGFDHMEAVNCLLDCENEEEFNQWLEVQKDKERELLTNPGEWLQIGDSEEMKTLKLTVLPRVRQALEIFITSPGAQNG